LGWLRFVPLWGAAVLAGTAYGAGWISGPKVVTPQGFSSASANFGSCYTGGGWC